jgi:hypothetical protein
MYFDCNSACYGTVVIACAIERACSFDGLGETYNVTAASCWQHSGDILVLRRTFVPAADKRILRSKQSSTDHMHIVFWVVLGEIRVTFSLFYLYSSSWIMWMLIVFNYTSLKTSASYTSFRATDNLLHSWKWNSFNTSLRMLNVIKQQMVY